MRIFSAYHDYYDSVQAFDPDPQCVYERKREEIEVTQEKFDLIPHHNEDYNNYGYRYDFSNHIKELILGFCGKLYTILLVNNNYPDPNVHGGRIFLDGEGRPNKWLSKSPTGPLYFYDTESFRKELDKNNFFKKKKKSELDIINKSIEFHDKFLKEWLDFESKMFVNLKTPIFLTQTVSIWLRMHRSNDLVPITLNPSLDVLEFYRVKNAFETYQEIEQFLSGILGMNDPEMVQIADKDMIVKKGFDKMSFRKPPGKKKPRKQKIAKA